LYLQSKWKELKTDSQRGIELFDKSDYLVKFKFFLAKALIQLEQFDAAKKVCIDITKTDHSYNNLSDALILLSYINRNMFGISRSYLYSLSEIISGFKDSGNMPAALYLLGKYYQAKGDFNKAYSAYSDVVAHFPKSPEAEFSKKELSDIAQHNPSRTGYIPDKDAIRKTDNIDIQPEIDTEDEADKENAKSDIQYSISLGPFDNIKSARDIKNLINKDFQPVEIAEVRNGFYIYAGRFAGIDQALKIKIRLAEEFGINGAIVKILKDAKKIYIYEE
jgi:tetratricopeptide (TPR) repeat protein